MSGISLVLLFSAAECNGILRNLGEFAKDGKM
jgi:hypothetical protein